MRAVGRSVPSFVAGIAIGVLLVGSMAAWRTAAAPGADTTFVPITPCRLFDYRPAPATVGPRSTPLGPNETATQQVTGSVGDCAIPSAATAVSMNVTIVLPTASSHLTVYPADAALPNASNLNWVADQSPTPNKVDVALSPTGAIKLHNHAGNVYVLADVVGYYTTAELDALAARLVALETAPGPYVDQAFVLGSTTLTSTPTAVVTLPAFLAPADGTVVLTATVWATSSPAGEDVYCAIGTTDWTPSLASLYQLPGAMLHEADDAANDSSMSGTRTLILDAGESATYTVWCARSTGATAGFAQTRNLVMTYIPD